MNSIWITAWIISAVLATGVWFCGRRSGLDRLSALVFAIGFFPAPLFVAIGGNNSFIYAFDAVVPLALYLAAHRWSRVPLSAKKAALWLLIGVGILPLLVCFALTDRQNSMYAAISFYRLLGAMALMCVVSAVTSGLKDRGTGLLAAFSWMNVVLVIATVLQIQGWINSNVFYSTENEISSQENESMRFITAGLFRGSLGIIGTLGWVALLAQYDARGMRGALALAGGVAGVLVIILCGSKTSLLVALFITVAAGILFPQVVRHLWGRLTIMSLALFAVVGIYQFRLSSEYFSYTLGVLGLADESMGTLSFRQERWVEAMEIVARDPMVLLGISTAYGQDDRGLGYFHNEYVALLMGGGIWGAGCYLAGLLFLGLMAFRQRKHASNGQVFAALTLICGLLQATTVNHIAPGIFFVCTTTIIACAYGLGFGDQAAARAFPEAAFDSESPALDLATIKPNSSPGIP